MFRLLSIVLLVVILGATFWSTAHKHEEQLKWQQSIEDLLTKPSARPDPWTNTMDDERTLKICAAIGLLAHNHSQQAVIISQLPEVCK